MFPVTAAVTGGQNDPFDLNIQPLGLNESSPSDDDDDDVVDPCSSHLYNDLSPAGVPLDSLPPSTHFYLVCGGEMTPERERQSRKHMDVLFNIIIEKGLAKDDHIMFVSGRGGKLNSISRSNQVSRGVDFNMYGPDSDELAYPLPQDNAVVIFLGQGDSAIHKKLPALITKNTRGYERSDFGDLLFVRDRGEAFCYAPHLGDLMAKNTLFISLADYSERAFERAFDRTDDESREEKLLAICLSSYFHAPSENYFGSIFADFFEGDTWKEKTISDFCATLEQKYDKHPKVLESKKKILKLTVKENFEEELRERSTWATGNFEHIMQMETISDQEWELFQEIEVLKQTVQGANETEMSSNLKGKLEETFSKMDTVRMDLTEAKLLRLRACKVVGDKDFSSLTWKEFLNLK